MEQAAVQTGDVIAIQEPAWKMPGGTTGVVTRVIREYGMLEVDFEDNGVRHIRASNCTLVERPPDLRADWDANAHIMRQIAQRKVIPLVHVRITKNDPDAA